MPRPVGYGRPGTPVFPDGWATAAAGVLDDTHESAVTIAAPGATHGWSESDGQTVTTPASPSYDGPATIRPASEAEGSSEPVAGEEQVTVTRYQVGLPQPTGGITVGQVVHVVSSPDAAVVGRDLTVVDIEHGDRRFTRYLYATLNS
ncbi:DUF6093 family protein [Pimelobacter simplex]|uniref:DUF6093 family protein n=1 Tax=Nocardioides simplex TaxID=2045 RepID=UPI00215001A1|nr:DUF6093 family protein [Pimelobacter simplex]UUW88464.1 DUF6093 family protein [Pimelobacter simplex]UUW97968.1 DUF6093 family protein [Pimelobacter simplex]